MSDQSLDPPAARVHQAQRVPEGVERVRDLERYPLRLFAPHMAEIFGVSLKRFYQLAAEGAFDFAVNKPRIGRMSWSRERVRQYFDGELRGLTVVRTTRKRA